MFVIELCANLSFSSPASITSDAVLTSSESSYSQTCFFSLNRNITFGSSKLKAISNECRLPESLKSSFSRTYSQLDTCQVSLAITNLEWDMQVNVFSTKKEDKNSVEIGSICALEDVQGRQRLHYLSNHDSLQLLLHSLTRFAIEHTEM